MRLSDLTPEACLWAREQISLRLDFALSEFEQVLLQAHLDGCEECRIHNAELEALTRTLRAAPLVEPTLAFQPPARHSHIAVRRVTRVATAAAAAAALAIGGFGSLGSSREPTLRLPSLFEPAKERQLQQLDGNLAALVAASKRAKSHGNKTETHPSGPDPGTGVSVSFVALPSAIALEVDVM